MSSDKLAPLLVLSGPSGVGKTTVVDELVRESGLPIRRAVTATSREPRLGEVDGTHYHFWSPERFQRAIAEGEMLEHAVVHGRDYYGTPRFEVDPFRQRGIGVILVIDVQGADQVRKMFPGDHRSVFLTVSDPADLRRRLESRGEPEASLQRRLQTAERELARAGEFDHRVVNDNLTATVAELAEILRTLFPKTGGG
jgi:guanylate kinase